jgi:protein SCO1/2
VAGMRSADRTTWGRLVIGTWLMLALPGMAAVPSGGLPVEPPKTIRAHSLTDHHGHTVNFPPADNRWQLVVFGYTHCPDVCPMTLHKISLVLKRLGERAGRVQSVFISIDSARDDAARMKDFVGQFDERILGLGGEPEALQAVANEFSVLTRRFQGKTAIAYTLNHSSQIYLVDPQARVRMMYPSGVEIEAIVRDLERLLG